MWTVRKNTNMSDNNNADIVVGESYRPDPALAAASLNGITRTLDTYRPGTMLQDPEEVRSIKPVNRGQLNAVVNKMIADTVNQVQGDVNRAIDTSTGFTPYVLETPAKVIFPVQAPLVQLTPRQVGKGTDIEHWKSVLSVFNQGGPFSQTHMGGTSDGSNTIDSPVYVLKDYSSTYQTIAEYNSVTFQSQWRSRALEGDMLARRKMELLYALKLQEENWLINGAAQLWRPAKPLVTASQTGGNLNDDTSATYFVQVAAVNGQGTSLPSAAASASLSAETDVGSLSITWSGVPGATSYKIYIGNAATQPANANMFICVGADFASGVTPTQPTDYIGSMSLTTTLVTAPTSGANPVTTGGATVNTNVFDGALSLCYLNGGSGGNLSAGEYGMTSVIISPAATSGLLALQDFQLLFRKMYSQSRADPSHLFLSPVESVTLDNLAGSASNFRINVDQASTDGIRTGQKVREILNQVTGKYVQVVTLPYLCQGTAMAGTLDGFPFPVPTISEPPFRVMINQDYTSVDYPPSQGNKQTYGFGYFVDECLVNQAQGFFGLIEGIQPAAGV